MVIENFGGLFEKWAKESIGRNLLLTELREDICNLFKKEINEYHPWSSEVRVLKKLGKGILPDI